MDGLDKFNSRLESNLLLLVGNNAIRNYVKLSVSKLKDVEADQRLSLRFRYAWKPFLS
jgi:hypothetical protein